MLAITCAASAIGNQVNRYPNQLKIESQSSQVFNKLFKPHHQCPATSLITGDAVQSYTHHIPRMSAITNQTTCSQPGGASPLRRFKSFFDMMKAFESSNLDESGCVSLVDGVEEWFMIDDSRYGVDGMCRVGLGSPFHENKRKAPTLLDLPTKRRR